MRTKWEYKPDYALPPGETLRETIEALKISQTELAIRTGRPVKTINEIIKGKTAITEETALQLERVLDVPASLWNNLERNYREALARQREKRRIEAEVGWLAEIPWRDMEKMGWVPQTDNDIKRLEVVLRFFGVASVDAWQEMWMSTQAAFRRSRSFRAAPGNVAAWLRKGELEAQQMSCDPYGARQFRSSLTEVKKKILSAPETIPEIQEVCARAGVAVVFVRELPKCPSGATRWLSPDKAVLQLSLRYKTDDHLWFTFFHEAGHILRHGKRETFIEEDHDTTGHEKEREADSFAENFLIPRSRWDAFRDKGSFNATDIVEFAHKVGVSPGIVVGRLQHEGAIPWRSSLNKLKQRLFWMS